MGIVARCDQICNSILAWQVKTPILGAGQAEKSNRQSLGNPLQIGDFLPLKR